uniref:Glucosamine 6-phosphate N-acetyltransferase n=1 Tax=Parascaris equorum TaxID=6256 RepID=A0A914R7R5_PAREQ
MLVGSATLVIEWKFIHEAGCRGRTEDVVVDQKMRGKHLGKLLNIYVVELARRIGVYKMSLECKDALISFYGQVGFKEGREVWVCIDREESTDFLGFAFRLDKGTIYSVEPPT